MRPDATTRAIGALLYRDARLHGGGLLLPGFLALVLSFLSLQGGETPMAFLGLSLVVALLVPHVLHLREESCGTLGELRALPVSDTAFVAARFLQGALAALLVVLVTLLCAVVHRGTAPTVDASWLSPGWLWLPFLVLALPMPVSLRWGIKGWLAAMGTGMGLGVLLAVLATLGRGGPEPPVLRYVLNPFLQAVGYLADHPWQHGLLLAAGIAACFPLSLRALRGRDL